MISPRLMHLLMAVLSFGYSFVNHVMDSSLSKRNAFGKSHSQIPVEFTNVCLLDGNNNQSLGRFVVHPTAESCRLKEDDIIELEQYAQKTYHVRDETPKPSVFIAECSVVG